MRWMDGVINEFEQSMEDREEQGSMGSQRVRHNLATE